MPSSCWELPVPTACSLRYDETMTKFKWLLAWLGVLGLAIVLRFWQLGAIPWGTYWDETAMLVDAKALAETGQDIHGSTGLQTIFPSYGDYKLPVYIWLASFSVKLFGATAWALRLPSAIIGVLGVLLVGALIRELWRDLKSPWQREIGALVAGFVMAVSPWDILFSRTGFEGHLGQFFLGLSVYLWLVGRRQPIWRWVSAVIGALATYCYYSVRFVWPPVIGILTLMEFWPSWSPTLTTIWHGQWRATQSNWRLIGKLFWPTVRQGVVLGVIPLIIFGVALLPLLKSPVAKDADRFRLGAASILNMADWPVISNEYREIAGNRPWDRVFYHRNWLMARELLNNYADHLNLRYLFVSGDSNLRHGTGQTGVFLWWALPGLLVGLYWWARHSPQWFIVLIVWWLAALLPASVPETTPHALRSLNSLIPLVLFITGGLTAVISTWWHWQARQRVLVSGLSWLVALGCLGGVATSVGVFADDYFQAYPARSAEAWQTGYTQLAQQIVQTNTQQAETWISQGDDKFFLWLLLQLDMKTRQPGPWLEKEYLFYQLGPYHLNGVDWSAVTTRTQPTLVVMRQTDLEKELADRKLTPSWSITSQPIPNQPLYQISAFNWPNQPNTP